MIWEIIGSILPSQPNFWRKMESRTSAFWMYATGFQSNMMCPGNIETLCFVNLSSDEVTPKERALHEQ